MTTSSATDRAMQGPARRVPTRYVVLGVLLLLVVAMALSTTYRSASDPVPGAQEKFDPASFARDNYASKVKPAIEEKPVALTTLAPLVAKDPDAAGEQYGTREGTSPYTYSVSFTGKAGKPVGGLMPVTVPGLPATTKVNVQVGPAINGTSLRDATGLVKFNDFVNQVEYAGAATALNTEMKKDVLEGLDVTSLVGQQVTVVGATSPLNPQLLTVTPVSLEVDR
jgi:predicted lipoprotein